MSECSQSKRVRNVRRKLSNAKVSPDSIVPGISFQEVETKKNRKELTGCDDVSNTGSHLKSNRILPLGLLPGLAVPIISRQDQPMSIEDALFPLEGQGYRDTPSPFSMEQSVILVSDVTRKLPPATSTMTQLPPSIFAVPNDLQPLMQVVQMQGDDIQYSQNDGSQFFLNDDLSSYGS